MVLFFRFTLIFISHLVFLPQSYATLYSCMPVKVVGPSGEESLEQAQYLENVNFYYDHSIGKALIQFNIESLSIENRDDSPSSVLGVFRDSLGPYLSDGDDSNYLKQFSRGEERLRAMLESSRSYSLKPWEWSGAKPSIWDEAIVFSDNSESHERGALGGDLNLRYKMVVKKNDLEQLPEVFLAQFYLDYSKWIIFTDGSNKYILDKYFEVSCARESSTQEQYFSSLFELEQKKLEDKETAQPIGGPGSVIISRENQDSRVVVTNADGNQEFVSEPTFRKILEMINDSPLEITSEGVFLGGSAVAGAVLIWRYGRSLNPIGAFVAGLGIAPVAASDYCSRFDGREGLETFFTLSIEEQLLEAKACSYLSGQIIETGANLQ